MVPADMLVRVQVLAPDAIESVGSVSERDEHGRAEEEVNDETGHHEIMKHLFHVGGMVRVRGESHGEDRTTDDQRGAVQLLALHLLLEQQGSEEHVADQREGPQGRHDSLVHECQRGEIEKRTEDHADDTSDPHRLTGVVTGTAGPLVARGTARSGGGSGGRACFGGVDAGASASVTTAALSARLIGRRGTHAARPSQPCTCTAIAIATAVAIHHDGGVVLECDGMSTGTGGASPSARRRRRRGVVRKRLGEGVQIHAAFVEFISTRIRLVSKVWPIRLGCSSTAIAAAIVHRKRHGLVASFAFQVLLLAFLLIASHQNFLGFRRFVHQMIPALRGAVLRLLQDARGRQRIDGGTGFLGRGRRWSVAGRCHGSRTHATATCAAMMVVVLLLFGKFLHVHVSAFLHAEGEQRECTASNMAQKRLHAQVSATATVSQRALIEAAH
jgi:hypothetical protein